MFNQVHIDPEVNTLVWPNGADFDPATLHDWQDHEQALGVANARDVFRREYGCAATPPSPPKP
ncbi:MAG: hypothetical protein M3Y07_04705 [Acidobacteriota bacterium]|nr:hypothetical protein [Acidobacteriota bacterium]